MVGTLMTGASSENRMDEAWKCASARGERWDHCVQAATDETRGAAAHLLLLLLPLL